MLAAAVAVQRVLVDQDQRQVVLVVYMAVLALAAPSAVVVNKDRVVLVLRALLLLPMFLSPRRRVFKVLAPLAPHRPESPRQLLAYPVLATPVQPLPKLVVLFLEFLVLVASGQFLKFLVRRQSGQAGQGKSGQQLAATARLYPVFKASDRPGSLGRQQHWKASKGLARSESCFRFLRLGSIARRS